MKAVSNTSPICYLVLIDEIDLLSQLFGEIRVPAAVRSELSDRRAPRAVRQWIAQPPAWLSVQTVSLVSNPVLDRLHPGEREAILLAHQCSADLILLDDKAARQAAQQLALSVAGLLGVLSEAARRGLLDLVDAVDRLRQTNFRTAPGLLRSILQKH